jgi:hypothetical protein
MKKIIKEENRERRNNIRRAPSMAHGNCERGKLIETHCT